MNSRLWRGRKGRRRAEKGCFRMVIRKGLCEWIAFGLRKRAAFLAQARQHKNEKPFINPLWQHFSTAPKLTEVSKFHPQNPTVSLQRLTLFRNFAVLRQHKGNPFAPIQILTGDIRKGCHTRCSRLLDERRSFLRKSCIERRFESSPESRGSQTSGYSPFFSYKRKE